MRSNTQNLLRLGNFSTLMALVSGLNHSAVTRLKFSKALLPKSVAKVSMLFASVVPLHPSFRCLVADH
jgi:hypothetical protein